MLPEVTWLLPDPLEPPELGRFEPRDDADPREEPVLDDERRRVLAPDPFVARPPDRELVPTADARAFLC